MSTLRHVDARKLQVTVEQVLTESGRTVDPPTAKVIAAVVVANPCAGQPLLADLSVLEELGRDAASLLVERAVAALQAAGYGADQVRGYGKGAIVGVNGELEHTAAILHPRFGAPVRAAIGGGTDIIPGTKKVAGPGAAITMPVGNKDDLWVFDDMDAVEVSIGDAPRADEIVIALVLSVGGRPHARVRKPS